MRIILNGEEKNIPSALSEFSLGQRIAFQEKHGNQLDEMAKSINDMPEGPEKELEALEFTFVKMFRSFSFFTGVPVEVLEESEFLDTIANVYYASLQQLFEEELGMELKQDFVWKGEEWEIAAPQLKHGDRMQFGELIDSKQVVKDMIELGKNRWEYLLPLCAIYLRKKGEAYNKEFLYEGSERLELMNDLPMDIALHVAFFLSTTANIFMSTLQSFSLPELKVAESTARPTSSATAG